MRRPFDLAAHGILFALCAAAGSPAAAQAQVTAQPPATPPDAPTPAQAATAPTPVPGADAEGDAPRIDFGEELRKGTEPMTADQAAARTVKTAPSVTRAQAQERRARAAAEEALVVAWPRLELEARYTRFSEYESFYESASGLFGGFVPDPLENQFLLQARLAIPLSDIFFQILPLYRAAGFAADAQALTAKAEAATIALAAREAFYNYARARASLLVVRASLEQSEAQRKDITALVSAGTLARVEVMRADAQVAAAQVAVARAESAVAVARTALRTLLHQPGNDDISIVEDWTQTPPPLRESQEQLMHIAVQERAELKALRTLVKSQDEAIDADNANRYPKLAVGGSFDYANPNQVVNPFVPEFNETWQVFAALTWSPNDYATVSKRAAQTEADRAATMADMQLFEDTLRREVAQGYEDYLASSKAIDSAATGIRAAEESYRVRREQFRAGAAVAIDVIDAEAELRRARLELINAAIDLRIARARLNRAVGRE